MMMQISHHNYYVSLIFQHLCQPSTSVCMIYLKLFIIVQRLTFERNGYSRPRSKAWINSDCSPLSSLLNWLTLLLKSGLLLMQLKKWIGYQNTRKMKSLFKPWCVPVTFCNLLCSMKQLNGEMLDSLCYIGNGHLGSRGSQCVTGVFEQNAPDVVTAGRELFSGLQNYCRMYCKTMKICTQQND